MTTILPFNTAVQAPLPTEGYRVLARKYRPTKLSEVIGQDFLVKTLKRGIEGQRLGHAFILTGIRGTGKTTTARIIARSLNCEAGPTPEPCGTCGSCTAIAQDNALDVIEIDAASRTGVDDIREIIDASQYKAVAARYKIYIIDEVHMLSKSAFNALLKTLEEPPAHVKFIFATTEIHKVPATILSRCVRFDLKRIESTTLADYFTDLCQREQVTFEEEAVKLIAKAAEGSVRDGLSLLDQAITYGSSHVATAQVREMLGLSDQGVLLEIFQLMMEGKIHQVLEKVRFLYQEGAEGSRLLEELLELTHWLQCLKINPELAQDIVLTAEKRQKGIELSEALSLPTLTRMWQILLKGFEEAKYAPCAQKALEVIMIRLTHMAPLPSLEELLEGGVEALSKKKASEGISSPRIRHCDSPPTTLHDLMAESPVQKSLEPFPSFEDLVTWAGQQREGMLQGHLHHDAHLVEFRPPHVTLRLGDKAPKTLPKQLEDLLKKGGFGDWTVVISDEIGHPTLHEKALKAQEDRRCKVLESPLVKKLVETFPGTTLTHIEDH